MEITSDGPSLTTMILKTDGLPVGADYINRVARQHAEYQILTYTNSASPEVQKLLTADSFERAVEAWWYDFEVKCKRNLDLAQKNALLEKIIFVPSPGLMLAVEEASHELARKTKQLIEEMVQVVQQMTARMPTVSAD